MREKSWSPELEAWVVARMAEADNPKDHYGEGWSEIGSRALPAALDRIAELEAENKRLRAEVERLKAIGLDVVRET